MDNKAKALCFFYRHPPSKKTKSLFYTKIAAMVTKKDGTHPTRDAVCEAVATFSHSKGAVGRPIGFRKTKKQDDTTILKTFETLRPPGHGVDSRMIHEKLPKKLRENISRRTVIRRLADKNFLPQKKIQKSDPGPTLMQRRLAFGRAHEEKSAVAWKNELQVVGDMKEFTFYPRKLRPKFAQLRAPWTYMTKKEKMKPAFVRPKRWFLKKDYKLVKKQKVFGFTTSTGSSLAFLVPTPFTTEKWAVLLRTKVYPFLKKTFPHRDEFQMLLDGERLLHGAAAKVVMAEKGIDFLPDWPKYSPDLNPQENVWAWAEKDLRKKEKDEDTFETFQQRVLKAVRAYPSGQKLIPDMAKRIENLIAAKGAMLKC